MRPVHAILLIVSVLTAKTAIGQSQKELFELLRAKDSLLFDIGFNECDLEQSGALLTDDLEFYHDQGGITASKAEFMQVMRSGICGGGKYTSRRELLRESLEVYPLYENGQLYGAIQMGMHRFYERKEDGPEREGSTARFTHLWLLEDGAWKIKRVLSYDHQAPPN
jgi:hypothetical protein